ATSVRSARSSASPSMTTDMAGRTEQAACRGLAWHLRCSFRSARRVHVITLGIAWAQSTAPPTAPVPGTATTAPAAGGGSMAAAGFLVVIGLLILVGIAVKLYDRKRKRD